MTEVRESRLLVTGSRDYGDVLGLRAALAKAYAARPVGASLVVVHDWDENPYYCSGAAAIAREWALEQERAGLPVRQEAFPADWEGPCQASCSHRDRAEWHGVSLCPQAGQRRNAEMCAGISKALAAMQMGDKSTNSRDCLARLFLDGIDFEMIIQGGARGLPKDLTGSAGASPRPAPGEPS